MRSISNSAAYGSETLAKHEVDGPGKPRELLNPRVNSRGLVETKEHLCGSQVASVFKVRCRCLVLESVAEV